LSEVQSVSQSATQSSDQVQWLENVKTGTTKTIFRMDLATAFNNTWQVTGTEPRKVTRTWKLQAYRAPEQHFLQIF